MGIFSRRGEGRGRGGAISLVIGGARVLIVYTGYRCGYVNNAASAATAATIATAITIAATAIAAAISIRTGIIQVKKIITVVI